MRKKILFLSHSSELYGAEKALLQTIEGLKKRDFEPVLVLPRTGPFQKKAEKLGVETVLVPFKWWLTEKNRVWKQPLSWLWNLNCIVKIARLVEEKSIDLVFSNSAVSFCGALAARWKRVPHIWSIHEIIGGENAPVRFLLGKGALVSFVSAFSMKIIVNSKTTGRSFGENKKVHVVPNGFVWSPQDRGLQGFYRQKYGYTSEDFVLGIIGKIYPEKGQMNVVEAIDRVVKTHPDTMLFVVGEVRHNKYFRGIQRFIADRKLEKNVIFKDYVPEIYDVLAFLDLLLVASNVESFGRVAVEAMSVKTPVLAVRTGAMAEIIVAGENGFLVDSSDPELLAEAILSIRGDPERMRKVVEKGDWVVREKFRNEDQIDKVEKIVRVCLGMNAENR
jgi:glycosyltransferase involved in cell wall biosynthesis